MRLIAQGRAADVFDLGDGTVLKRHRDGPLAEHEAAVTAHAHAHGFPVPAVHDAAGTDLVLERLDGHTMLTELDHRPWRMHTYARMLGELHRRLHELPGPPGRPARICHGDRLVHLDLHPDNVMLTTRGPVVIDWTAGGCGLPADDVGYTQVIVGCSEIPGSAVFRAVARAGRARFLHAFLAHAGEEVSAERLAIVARSRLTDPHLLPAERTRVEALLRR